MDIPVNVVPEWVVTGKHNNRSESDAQGEETLRHRLVPRLQDESSKLSATL